MKILFIFSFFLIFSCSQVNSTNNHSNNLNAQVSEKISESIDTSLFGDWQVDATEVFPEAGIKMVTTIFWQFKNNGIGSEVVTIKSIPIAKDISFSFTVSFPFTWKTIIKNKEKELEFTYGIGSLINPPPTQIEEYEPKENIELANDIMEGQSNKLITTIYSRMEDILFIKTNPNSKEPLKFKLLPSSNYCDISDLQKSSIQQTHHSPDRLLKIFVLCKSYKLQVLDYERKGEELGRKIKLYLEKNQKEQAIHLLNVMLEELKKSNQGIINNSQNSDMERLHELLYCYNLLEIKTFIHVKQIFNSNEPSNILLEKMISYFKNGTNDDNKKLLAISAELIRMDELFGLSKIRVRH